MNESHQEMAVLPAVATTSPRKFIGRIPWILKLPEPLIQWIAGVLGVGLGIFLTLQIQMVAPRGGILANFFGPDGRHVLIPAAIACMFLWSLFICLIRRIRLWALRVSSGKARVLDITSKINTPEDVTHFSETLKDQKYAVVPLFRRLQGVIDQWLLRPSMQNADIILQQHVNHDYDSIQAGYSLLRIFIWALPVIGLVGTVLGIAEAVAGFAKFLQGNVEEVKQIKESLVTVTGGLSFAFLITLQGLITSLIVMLIASPLQTREERLFVNMQSGIIDFFLPKLQRILPETEHNPGDDLAIRWREAIQKIIGDITTMVSTAGIRILDEEGKRHDILLETVGKKLTAASDELAQAQRAILAETASIGKQLLGELDQRRETQRRELSQWSSGVRQDLERAAVGVREVLAGIQSAQAAFMEGLKQQCEQLQAVFEAHSHTLQAVAAAPQERLRQLFADLEPQFRLIEQSLARLQETNLQKCLADLTAALLSQDSRLQAASQEIKELAAATNTLLQNQVALQAAMRQLHDTGLEQTLASLRDSLTALGSVLAGFQKPFVLQAVQIPEAR